VSTEKSTSGSKVTLKIPARLYRSLSEIIEGTGFRSVTEFAVYVLRDIVASGKPPKESPHSSRKEVQSTLERLRALGYFD